MNLEIILNASLETAILQVTQVLKEAGFGILTRIDFDQKIKEKLGITLPKTTILGACNPQLAYEAYQKDPNMLLLIKPTFMMKTLGSKELETLAVQADLVLEKAIHSLK